VRPPLPSCPSLLASLTLCRSAGAPSTDLPTIHTRLSLVSAFLSPTGAPSTRAYLRALLRTLDDTPRLLQRLALRRAHPAHDLLGLKRTMRALEVVRAELDALGPDAVACADAREAVRGLAEQLGAYDVLADEIDAAIDEDALSAREEQAEKAAALAAELGERAASRAMMETSTPGRTAGDEGEGESLWGEAQAWVIRPKCVLLSLPRRLTLSRASQLIHLPTPSFSTSLAKLHADLASLREQAAALQDELRARYKSKNLTLKVAQRVGPAVHIFVRDGVKEIDKDPAALVHQKTNSTRLYVNRVRLSLLSPRRGSSSAHSSLLSCAELDDAAPQDHGRRAAHPEPRDRGDAGPRRSGASLSLTRSDALSRSSLLTLYSLAGPRELRQLTADGRRTRRARRRLGLCRGRRGERLGPSRRRHEVRPCILLSRFGELVKLTGVSLSTTRSSSLEIVAGRHPTVENALVAQMRSFTPNSVTFRHLDDFDDDASVIHVLTGPVRRRSLPSASTPPSLPAPRPDAPTLSLLARRRLSQNMAGKSTFLRQTALICVLAQAGSYVPAERATIGVCDRVYSRVGARDELDRDRSTFMIEMDEATTILENATSRSLVRP